MERMESTGLLGGLTFDTIRKGQMLNGGGAKALLLAVVGSSRFIEEITEISKILFNR
ncbi:hypothetical protein PPACK8108_LOCUS9926 [Phakopsora pachyrhizi]|uniref:Uncharacterized protein n=1 Tax=Phakopsora pachyrhizi TaxID=170000 RepID=A0AAV0B021_PHAPC|nr:hypothetical protein PPACK8108_LOCUS9926 [Phakopsora pachyrhizi]